MGSSQPSHTQFVYKLPAILLLHKVRIERCEILIPNNYIPIISHSYGPLYIWFDDLPQLDMAIVHRSLSLLDGISIIIAFFPRSNPVKKSYQTL